MSEQRRHQVLVEICCGSFADAQAAAQGGADRIELCSALELGGLTPSLGALRLCKQHLGIPIMAMLRPRASGFHYNDAELAELRTNAKIFIEHGADGLVFGFLNEDGTVNEAQTREFVSLAAGRQTVFHRAFDATPDPFGALETLIACGVTRILTSGQAGTAAEGAALIARLIQQAAGRIEILPAAGVRPHNAAAILAATGAEQLHASAQTTAVDRSLTQSAIRFRVQTALPETAFPATDPVAVAALREAVRDRS